jgi:hypothetical protein
MAEPTSLLPEPVLGELNHSDALSLLYVLEAQDQELGVHEGAAKVSGLQTERDQALQKEKQAIQNEDDAVQKKSFWDDLGGVLGDVAKIAGVVASLAAVVCTAGAATPIAALAISGVVLSAASLADGEFHLLQKLGVDQSTAGWIDVGMGVAGGVACFGAGIAAGVQASASATSVVGRIATATSGVATIGQGASVIEQGEAQSKSERADADVALEQSESQQALRVMQLVIDEVRESDEQSKQIMDTLVAAKGTINSCATNAASAIQG